MVSGVRGLIGTYVRPVVVEELSGEPASVKEELTVEWTVLAQEMNNANATTSHVQVKLSLRFVIFNEVNFNTKSILHIPLSAVQQYVYVAYVQTSMLNVALHHITFIIQFPLGILQ